MFYNFSTSFKNTRRILGGIKKKKIFACILLVSVASCAFLPYSLEKDLSKSRSFKKLVWPLRGKVIKGYKKGVHKGIDIEARGLMQFRSAASGQVVLVKRMGGYKTIIIVKHPRRLFTVYANVRHAFVKEGQAVKRGEIMGVVRGHLHFEVRVEGRSANPLRFLSP